MGYITEFYGRFHTDRPMDKELVRYINDFSKTRHMKRDVKKVKENDPDWQGHCFCGDLGIEGAYYIDEKDYGFAFPDDVLDINRPPEGVPGLWCDWTVPEDDASAIEWDGVEKFYDYEAWLQYLIDNFLKPQGYVLNGAVFFQGEESYDSGFIVVCDNEVSIVPRFNVTDEFQKIAKQLTDGEPVSL